MNKLNKMNLEQIELNNKANDRRMEINTKRIVKQMNSKSKSSSLLIRPGIVTRSRGGAKKLDTESLSSMDEEDYNLEDVSLSSSNKENQAELNHQNVN
jgi:hypothetical protein